MELIYSKIQYILLFLSGAELSSTVSDTLVFSYFSVLVSVLYATTLTSLGRYRLFETHRVFSKKFSGRSFLRLLVGILSNIIGISILITGFAVFVKAKSSVSSFIAASLWSFAIYSIPRIVHAICATKLIDTFYGSVLKENLKKKYDRKHEGTFWSHFFPGLLIYIGLPLISLWFVSLR